jgi:predicted O-methyltransferase YrrM/tRNA G18 (ribose-2'-O)-methylase SpoU
MRSLLALSAAVGSTLLFESSMGLQQPVLTGHRKAALPPVVTGLSASASLEVDSSQAVGGFQGVAGICWHQASVTVGGADVGSSSGDSSLNVGLKILDQLDSAIGESKIDTGACQLALTEGGVSLSVGGLPPSNAISLPIVHGKVSLGQGQDLCLHIHEGREGHAREWHLSCTWCGSEKKKDLQGHSFNAQRARDDRSDERERYLRAALVEVGVNAEDLFSDEFVGSAALRAFHSYVCPRPAKRASCDQEPLPKSSERVSHQISFLVRQHKAERTEHLRNRDRALEEYKAKGLEPHGIAVVCDNLRSAYNVGSIFRTADGARAAEVVTCGLTPHPLGPGDEKIRKTAFNSVNSVASRHFDDPKAAVAKLKEEGYRVFAMETTDDAVDLYSLDIAPDDKVALVVGNEVSGVAVDVMHLCDAVVEIPLYGAKNSLNVCMATAIAIYEVLRKWRRAGSTDAGGGGSAVQVHAMERQQGAEIEMLEQYAEAHSMAEPPLLTELRERTAQVQPQAAHMLSSTVQGRLLKFLVQAMGAKRVLEIGTFTGCSSLCFAEGGAEVLTCEKDVRAAEIAQEFFDRSDYGDHIQMRRGAAMVTLEGLVHDCSQPFDFVFIDGDKKRYWDYYDFVLGNGLLRPGGIIVADNVLFKGLVAKPPGDEGAALEAGYVSEGCSSGSDAEGPSATDTKTRRRMLKIAAALHEFNERVNSDPRTEAVMLPLRDGLTIVQSKA